MSVIDTIKAAMDRPDLPELAATLADLLTEAADRGLPSPLDGSVRGQTGSIALRFPHEHDSVKKILAWATAYGSVVMSDLDDDHYDGPAEIYVRTEFTYQGVRASAYAFIPVPEKGPEPQHADYPHEPGRLYGCPACEARCHCTPDTAECVYGGPHAVPPF